MIKKCISFIYDYHSCDSIRIIILVYAIIIIFNVHSQTYFSERDSISFTIVYYLLFDATRLCL